MTPTDQAAFLERVSALLATAPAQPPAAASDSADTDAGDSLLTAPMAVLNAPPRRFAEVYGPEGRLLAHLAAQAAANGEGDMARLLDRLGQGLRDGTFDLPPAPTPAPRLTRFAYPVV